MDWFPLDALPAPMVAYCRAGIDAYRAGGGIAVHFQDPGDPIAHDPAHSPPATGRARRPCGPSPSPIRKEVFRRDARGRHPDCRRPRSEGVASDGGVRGDAAQGVRLRGGVLHRRGRPSAASACRLRDGPPVAVAGRDGGPGERPWETAVRETEEETGIWMPGPPRLLAAVFGLPGARWPLATTGFVFDGGRLTARQIAAVTLDPDEHDEVRVLPLDDWRPLMPGKDFARLRAVLHARRTGMPAYFDTWDWD
ncbi:NUDIX domain-containing protein [Streptomyces zhihengii]